MTRRTCETFGFVLAFTLLGIGGGLLCAQDPFGAPAEGMPPADMPPMAEKKDDKKAAGPAPTEDIVILSIRESNPTTPAQIIRAVKALLDYGAYDEARLYLTKLLAAKPTIGELAAVQRQYGSAFFIKLSREKRIAPEGRTVAEAVMDSARRIHDDPERLRFFAKQATADDSAAREEALIELRNAGPSAIGPLLKILGNANLPKSQAFARDALVSLGETAVEPMLAVLEAPNDELRTQAIAVLTRLRSSRVVTFLLRPAHDPHENPRVQSIAREALKRLNGRVPPLPEVEDYLYAKATGYFEGASPLMPDQDGLVTMYAWDNQNTESVPRYYPANLDAIQLPEIRGVDGVLKRIESAPASALLAARVAGDLYALFPSTPAYKQLFLATHLEAAKLQAGLGAPLPTGKGTTHAMVSLVEPTAIEDALGWSIKHDHFVAAIAAAEVLGDVGDQSLLTSPTGAPQPLGLALRHPDRRLRFAAAEAIMKLNVKTAFAGASHVPETFGYLAGSVGTRRALIADVRIEEARIFSGLLSSVGYDVDVAQTGDAALQLVLEQPDYEVIFLGDSIDHQDLTRTWQQLRKDPRTANLLIALTGREENMEALRDKADTDPLARAMPYIHTGATLDFQMTQLFRKAGTKFVPFAERQRQAIASLDHLGRLANDGPTAKHYDLQRQEEAVLRALATAGLTVHAAPVLGGLASHTAQLALVNLASDTNFDIVDRQAAAKAFAAAVERRGVLLTTREIGAQFDRYNASESLDTDTQAVLASILDTIEARSKRNVTAERNVAAPPP
jgi:CheY-like chemotaxis protein